MVILILKVMLCVYTIFPYTEKFLTTKKMTLYEIYIIFKKIENAIYRILFVLLILFCVFTKSWMTMGRADWFELGVGQTSDVSTLKEDKEIRG